MLINTHQVFGGCSSVMDKRRGQKWYCLKTKEWHGTAISHVEQRTNHASCEMIVYR